ncbi:MAG: hypothetical protein AB2L20_32245 [Mangrovibacterium sp.]
MKNITILISLFILFSCTRMTEKEIVPTKPGMSSDIKIEKAFISFRIGTPLWISERRCNELFALFDKYKGVTDEITFFTSGTHAPLPLNVFKERTAILKERMSQARERGYKTGINILTTIGHHNENLENSLQGDYVPMTNIDGATCKGSFCPNDEQMREYIRKIYQFTTNANPDYIWIDDDIRFGHMPIGNGCFCDRCLQIFEEESGLNYTRESLKKAFNEGQTAEKLKIREAWLQHNRNTISHLFELIEKTVHEINPAMPLGFMTGDRFFEGYDFENWANTLAGANHAPVMWRPGGGYYEDSNTDGLAGKSHDIGRQVSLLPEEVVSIQSEIENFPYQRLKKAAHIVVLEACSHIAAGCTGAAFNVLSMYDEPLDEYEALISRLQESRPFFDLLAQSLGRSSIHGVQTFWNKSSCVTGSLKDGNWTGSGCPLVNHEFYDIGLPVCYSNKCASVTILGKDNVLTLPKEEIKKLLSGGVYMDAEALQQLNEMGFDEFTGFEITGSETKDCIEKFTDHPLNGEFTGRERDNRQSFWNSRAFMLRKTDEKAQTLAGLIDYAGKEVAACTTGIYENKLGGRICVAGYYPWTFMENLSKSSQMKAVFRWLSRDSLPGYIASFQKINLWIREPQNGKIALAFTNSSFDPAEDIVLMLKTDQKTIRLYDMDCNETVIRSSGQDGPYQKFVIPEVAPWQMRLVVNEK